MKFGTSGVIFSSAITGYVQKSIRFLVSIITLPLIVSSLGKEQYGILILISQTVGFLALSDIGVTNSVGRFISKYIAKDNANKVKEVIQTAFILLSIVAIAIIIITLTIFNWIPDWLNISDEYSDITKLLFVINGFFLALMFPSRIGQGILAGKQMYPLINLLASIIAFLQLGGVILLHQFEILGLIELAFLMLGTNLIYQLVIVGIAYNNTISFSLKKLNFSIRMAKDILSLGSSSFLISLSGILISQGLVIAIGIINNTVIAGIYGVVMLVITNITFVLTKMSQPMVTLASELLAQNNHEKLKGLILFVMRISLVIGIFISVSLFFYIETLLKMLLSQNWNAREYLIASSSIIIMSISITIGIPQFVSRAVLQGVGQHWQAGIGKITASVVSFGVGVVLIILGFEVLGASIGWGLVWILQGVFYFPRLICKFMKINIKDLIVLVYVPGYFIGIILLSVGYLFKQIHLDYSLIMIVTYEIVLFSIALLLLLVYQKMFDKNHGLQQIINK